MSARFAFLVTVLLPVLTVGCQTLKDQLSKDDAAPAGSTTAQSSKRAPVAAGLEPGWELAPTGTYTAMHSNDQVTIRATGEHPSAGYEAKLVQSPLRIWPPQWLLGIKKPDGAAAAVMTPFEATASFPAKDPVEMVSLRDARGLQKVPVKQSAPATAPSAQPAR